MFEYDRSRAMKQKDFEPCRRCGRGVAHGGSVLFYRVTVERIGIDVGAVRRHAGLEALLGGHAGLAAVMGVDADIGLPVGDADRGLLCDGCALAADMSVAELLEILAKKDEG